MGLESEEGHTMIWRWVSVTYAVRFGESKQAKRRLWRAICQRMSQLGSTGYYGHMNTSKSFEVKVSRSNLDSLAWLFFFILEEWSFDIDKHKEHTARLMIGEMKGWHIYNRTRPASMKSKSSFSGISSSLHISLAYVLSRFVRRGLSWSE